MLKRLVITSALLVLCASFGPEPAEAKNRTFVNEHGVLTDAKTVRRAAKAKRKQEKAKAKAIRKAAKAKAKALRRAAKAKRKWLKRLYKAKRRAAKRYQKYLRRCQKRGNCPVIAIQRPQPRVVVPIRRPAPVRATVIVPPPVAVVRAPVLVPPTAIPAPRPAVAAVLPVPVAAIAQTNGTPQRAGSSGLPSYAAVLSSAPPPYAPSDPRRRIGDRTRDALAVVDGKEREGASDEDNKDRLTNGDTNGLHLVLRLRSEHGEPERDETLDQPSKNAAPQASIAASQTPIFPRMEGAEVRAMFGSTKEEEALGNGWVDVTLADSLPYPAADVSRVIQDEEVVATGAPPPPSTTTTTTAENSSDFLIPIIDVAAGMKARPRTEVVAALAEATKTPIAEPDGNLQRERAAVAAPPSPVTSITTVSPVAPPPAITSTAELGRNPFDPHEVEGGAVVAADTVDVDTSFEIDEDVLVLSYREVLEAAAENAERNETLAQQSASSNNISEAERLVEVMELECTEAMATFERVGIHDEDARTAANVALDKVKDAAFRARAAVDAAKEVARQDTTGGWW